MTYSSGVPINCQVSQSWGSITPLTFLALSGSLFASQRNFVTVKDATGTDPTASAHLFGPPNSLIKSVAACADRVSFHNNASLTTCLLSSITTMPCCWAPIDIASTSSNKPLVELVNSLNHLLGEISVASG